MNDFVVPLGEPELLTAEIQGVILNPQITKSPYIDPETGNWMVWSADDGVYVDSGVHAEGPQGEKGDPGEFPDLSAYRTAAEQDVIDATKADVDDIPEVPVKGVQVAGTDLVPDADGKVDVPPANASRSGVVRINGAGLTLLETNGRIGTQRASTLQIDNRNDNYGCIVTSTLDYAVKAAMTDGVGAAWTESEQKAGRKRMDAASDREFQFFKELTKGQAWDTEKLTSPTHQSVVPSGAHGFSNNRIGGKTVVMNQHCVYGYFGSDYATYWDVYRGVGSVSNGALTVTGAVGRNGAKIKSGFFRKLVNTHKYLYSVEYKSTVELQSYGGNAHILPASENWTKYEVIFTRTRDDETTSNFDTFPRTTGEVGDFSIRNVNLIDLTQLFGAGSEPSTVEEIKAWLPLLNGGYYPYNEGELVSADVIAIEAEDADHTKHTAPIPAALLTFLRSHGWGQSAGTVYNYVDWTEKKYYRNVGEVDLGTLTWQKRTDLGEITFSTGSLTDYAHVTTGSAAAIGITAFYGNPLNVPNGAAAGSMADKTCAFFYPKTSNTFYLNDSRYSTVSDLIVELAGTYLQYELATPEVYDISSYIDEPLSELCEAGGTLTFVQSDTDYNIKVPNDTDLYINLSEVV